MKEIKKLTLTISEESRTVLAFLATLILAWICDTRKDVNRKN